MTKLFPFSSPKTVTQTFNSSQNVVVPSGVTVFTSVSGKGADGTPATDGYYGPNTSRNTYVTSVSGNSGSGGNTPGTLYWDYVQSNGSSDVYNINGGGSGSIAIRDYVQYSDGYSNTPSTTTFNNSVPGSAYSYTSAGWKTTGPVTTSDFAFMYVAWQEYGAWVPGTAATTGASATGFGCTFPGGAGGPATTTSVNNVAVNPGQSYPLNIPSGGSITIQYTTS